MNTAVNTIENEIIRSPDDVEEECIKFTIDDTEEPFALNEILVLSQIYTFSAWIKADVATTLSVGGKSIEAGTEWERKSVTFTSDSDELEIYFAAAGIYYMWHPQLEIGVKATDYRINPDDLEEALYNVSLKLTKDGITSIVGTYYATPDDVTAKVNEVQTTITQTAKDLTVKITDAAKTATNFLKYDGGLIVGEIPQAEDGVLGNNVLITTKDVQIRNGEKILGKFAGDSLIIGSANGKNIFINDEGLLLRDGDTVVATFTDGYINLGKVGTTAGFDTTISMLSGKLKIVSNSYGDGTNYIKSPDLDLNIYAPVLTLSCADEYSVAGVDPQIRLFNTGEIDINAENISINGNIEFSLYTPTLKISSLGTSSMWVNGRDNAMMRMTICSYAEYRPMLSLKALDSSWEIGTYGTFTDDLVFVNITDDNYSSGTNTAERQIRFHSTGYVKGLIGCDDAWNVGGSVYADKNFVCTSNGHGIYGRHTDGTAKRLAVISTSSAGTSKDAVNCCIFGNADLRTYITGASFYIAADKAADINYYSDKRLKKDIEQLDERYLEMFDNLECVTYNWKHNEFGSRKNIGFIAQQVEKAMNDAGIATEENYIVTSVDDVDRPENGEILTLGYGSIDTIGLYALQDARRRIKRLEEEILKLKQAG